MSDLATILRAHPSFAPVIPADVSRGHPLVLDFSAANSELAGLDITDTPAFTAWLFERIDTADPPVGLGRYGEDRVVYRHSPLFDGEAERRSLHLGVDLFAAAGTPVQAPLAGVVHSAADNANLGDYGPTVLLEHELGDRRFWTLYGHLDRASLTAAEPGREVAAGEAFAALGDLHENGGWPPHLHFQVISDIGSHRGDFPGVAPVSARESWLERCPDPNLILRIPALGSP